MVMLALILVYLLFSLFFMVPMMADLLRSLEVKEGFLFKLDDFRHFLLEHYALALIFLILVIAAFALLGPRLYGTWARRRGLLGNNSSDGIDA